MIATLEIDDDIFADAERLASQQCRPAGKVLSELARQGLMGRTETNSEAKHLDVDSESEVARLDRLPAELAEFLAARPSLSEVANYKIAPPYQRRLEQLLDKNREEGLDLEEKTELEAYFQLRHLVMLLKARARRTGF